MRVQWGTGTTAAGFTADSMLVSYPQSGRQEGFTLADLSGGFLPLKQWVSWGEQNARGEFVNRNRTFENQGVHVHNPGIALKGYASTVQTSLISADFSGARAGNFRVHHIQWPTTSGTRNIFLFKSFLIKDTSTSDPALTVPSTADNITDNVMAAWLGDVDGTLALFIGTDGTTDDIKYTTDPTANSVSWTSAVTYAHADDHCWAGVYLPQYRKHVIWAVINQVAGVYEWNADDTLPMTSTTLTPVVYTEGKDVTNNDNTTLDTGFLTGHTAAPADGAIGFEPTTTEIWQDVSNALTDNGSYASVSSLDGSGTFLYVYFDTRSSLPESNAEIVGVTQKYQRLRDAADNAGTQSLFLANGVDHTQFSRNYADSASWATTVEEITSGGSSDLLGTDLTLAQWRMADLQVVLLPKDETAGSQSTCSVEAFAIKLHYKRNGEQVVPVVGGHGKGSALASFADIVPTIEPLTDDDGAINVARRLVYNTFSLDGDRLTMSISYPYTGLPYVGGMADHLGGLAVYGGADSTTWDQVVLVGPDPTSRDVENLELPPTYGDSDTVRVHGLFERNASSALFGLIHHGDSADAQLWINSGGAKWNAYGVLQSLSGTAIATAPIPFAMTAPTSHAYRFFPNSTTSLHVTREFVDDDPFDDSRLVNSSENRHTGVLRVQTPWFMFDLPDEDHTLNALEVNSLEIDDGTTYDSIAVEFDNGDITMATPDVDETFDATAEVFTRRDISSAGIAFTTGIGAIEFAASSGAKTPQALPITFYISSAAEEGRTFEFRGVKPDFSNLNLLARIETLRRTKSTQELQAPHLIDESGTSNVPCIFEGMTFVDAEDGKQDTRIRFVEVRGGSA